MEFHAYNFRGTYRFPANEIRNYMKTYPNWYGELSHQKFNWTFKANTFKNIFN